MSDVRVDGTAERGPIRRFRVMTTYKRVVTWDVEAASAVEAINRYKQTKPTHDDEITEAFTVAAEQPNGARTKELSLVRDGDTVRIDGKVTAAAAYLVAKVGKDFAPAAEPREP